MTEKRCLECNRLIRLYHRRGLCRRCYRTPSVRERYAPLPRGAWAAQGYGCRTAHDRIRLIDLFDAGMSDKGIAEATDRTVWAVAKERQRLGLAVSVERQALHRRKAN